MVCSVNGTAASLGFSEACLFAVTGLWTWKWMGTLLNLEFVFSRVERVLSFRSCA